MLSDQILDRLERLASLHQDGTLSDAEYQDAKSNLLALRSSHEEPLGDPPNEPVYYQPHAYDLRSKGYPSPLMACCAVVLALGIVFTAIAPSSPTEASTIFAATDGSGSAEEGAAIENYGVDSYDAPYEGYESEASDALDAASRAIENASNSLEYATGEYETGDTQEHTAVAESAPAAESSFSEANSARSARCRVNILGEQPMTGSCSFTALSRSEFDVRSASASYVARVVMHGNEHHGWVFRSDGSSMDLGPVTQEGACWTNSSAEICAWAV